MARKLKERPYGGGRYTHAGYWGFIRSGLRNKYQRWAPKYEVLEDAKVKSREKRYKWKYRCKDCGKLFPRKEIEVDHIVPAGSLRKAEDLPGFVTRLFCEKEGLQVLCKTCHKGKTNAK